MKKESNLLVKMFYKHYDNGEILPGRFAHQLNEEAYLLFKQDLTSMEVRVGDHIKNAGNVDLDHNNNLKIGPYTIIVGNDPIPGYQAHKTNSKTKFKIHRPDGHSAEYKVGDTLENFGKITQDEHGRIYANDKNIPIFQKVHELNLIVFPQAKGPGYSAYFNKLVPGDKDNRGNGIPGTFVAGDSTKPSKFFETGPDGNLYATALIRPNEGGRTVRCILRSLDDAILERVMINDLESIKKTEADPYDIDPNDVQQYVELKQKLDEYRATMWQQREFSVTKGHRLLGLASSRNNERQRQPTP